MKRKAFFAWLDTIIKAGGSDWFLVEELENGEILIRFNNVEREDNEIHN